MVSFFEAISVILVLIFGTGIGALILWKLFDVVRNSIKKNKTSYDEERFDRLAKAFIEHKKDSERRFQNLEAIITDEEPIPASTSSSNRTQEDSRPNPSIEIEENDTDEENEERANLQSMLNKKRTR